MKKSPDNLSKIKSQYSTTENKQKPKKTKKYKITKGKHK